MGVTAKRLYKSGSRFALWRWTFTPSGYLTRLFLAHTPWGGVMLHWINGPDPEPDPHNHPVTFLSLILRGGYCEVRVVKFLDDFMMLAKLQECRWWNFIKARDDIHKIISVWPWTLTLVFYGPKRCEWGFFCKDGFMYWKDYNRKYKEDRT